MPYNCEECGELGARMNALFEIRLCINCVDSLKYKLICKSKAQSEFILTKSDFNNYPYKEFYAKNPHYKSGPYMTLYFESDIHNLFLNKYNDLIHNNLNIFNLDLHENIEYVKQSVINYLKNQKISKKQQKYQKILTKYNIIFDDLPEWMKDKLDKSKNFIFYEFNLSSYLRFIQLRKLLKQEKLIEYLDHTICHNFIYQTNTTINIVQIPSIIRFMLDKKKIIKNAIKTYNIPSIKYKQLISNYINSFETNITIKTISNDLNTLIYYITEKEKRINELVDGLKAKGLELRSDSVLCSKYIEGSNEYSCEEIINIMEQMNWFFCHTKYSQYSKQYDYENRQYDSDYYQEYNYYHKYNINYSEYDELQKYNKNSMLNYMLTPLVIYDLLGLSLKNAKYFIKLLYSLILGRKRDAINTFLFIYRKEFLN